jgi:hypothetical protein
MANKTTNQPGDNTMAAQKKETKSRAAEFILPQDYANPLEDISDIPLSTAKKMKKSVYFRTKDGKGFVPLQLMILPDPRDMEEQGFLVHPTIISELSVLADQLKTYVCHLVITRDGEKKILYTPAVTELNKGQAVVVARAKIIEESKNKWLRMTWDPDVRIHRAVYPKFPIPEPEWGILAPLAEMIFQAFDGRVIESADHELVKYLLGGA